MKRARELPLVLIVSQGNGVLRVWQSVATVQQERREQMETTGVYTVYFKNRNFSSRYNLIISILLRDAIMVNVLETHFDTQNKTLVRAYVTYFKLLLSKCSH